MLGWLPDDDAAKPEGYCNSVDPEARLLPEVVPASAGAAGQRTVWYAREDAPSHRADEGARLRRRPKRSCRLLPARPANAPPLMRNEMSPTTALTKAER